MFHSLSSFSSSIYSLFLTTYDALLRHSMEDGAWFLEYWVCQST